MGNTSPSQVFQPVVQPVVSIGNNIASGTQNAINQINSSGSSYISQINSGGQTALNDIQNSGSSYISQINSGGQAAISDIPQVVEICPKILLPLEFISFI